MTAERPTAPAPKTAKALPGCESSALRTAPAPVRTPQPSGARSSSGTSAGAGMTDARAAFVLVANALCPKKCEPTDSSPRRNAVVPSSRAPPKFRAS